MDIKRDELTGLWNRGTCIEFISGQLKKKIDLCVVLIDIDFFTNINARIGKDEGDRVLSNISRYLSDVARDGITGKYGGDEFILIYHKKDDIRNVIDGLFKNFKQQRFIRPESPYAKVTFTISAGIAASSVNINATFLLLKTAETALAMAKKKGRNRFETARDAKIHILKSFARVTTVAGGGLKGDAGDGIKPFRAGICEPYGVEIYKNGELLIVDRGNHKIRRIDSRGVLRTEAGTGVSGYAGDNGPAKEAMLCKPSGVAAGPDNCLYIADTGNHCIRKIDNEGIITTFAGGGTEGYEGDGGKARTARLRRPGGVVTDGKGNIYTNDYGNNVIRMITSDVMIHTVAGSGDYGYGGDTKSAVLASMDRPYGIAVNREGSKLYIADYGNHCIREVDMASGIISTLCGTGAAGYSGDGGDCSGAQLNGPFWVSVWGKERLFIADGNNNCIRVINLATKRIDTLAGNTKPGYRDVIEGVRDARFNTPAGLAVDCEKELLYVADYANNAIRKIVLRNLMWRGYEYA